MTLASHSPHPLCILRFAADTWICLVIPAGDGERTPNASQEPFSPFSWYPSLCYGYQGSECSRRSMGFILFVSCAALRIHGYASLSPQGMARGLRMALASHSPRSLCILRFTTDTKAPNAPGGVWVSFSLYPALRYGYKGSEWLLRAIFPILFVSYASLRIQRLRMLQAEHSPRFDCDLV